MSWPDLLFAAIVLGCTVSAARRGFVREASAVLGLAGAFYLAGRLQPGLARLIAPEGGEDPLVRPAAYAFLAATLLMLAGVAGARAHALVVGAGSLRRLDRLAGAGFGILEGAALAGLVALLLARIGLAPLDSQLARPLLDGLAWLASRLPPELVAVEPLGP